MVVVDCLQLVARDRGQHGGHDRHQQRAHGRRRSNADIPGGRAQRLASYGGGCLLQRGTKVDGSVVGVLDEGAVNVVRSGREDLGQGVVPALLEDVGVGEVTAGPSTHRG